MKRIAGNIYDEVRVAMKAHLTLVCAPILACVVHEADSLDPQECDGAHRIPKSEDGHSSRCRFCFWLAYGLLTDDSRLSML